MSACGPGGHGFPTNYDSIRLGAWQLIDEGRVRPMRTYEHYFIRGIALTDDPVGQRHDFHVILFARLQVLEYKLVDALLEYLILFGVDQEAKTFDKLGPRILTQCPIQCNTLYVS